MRLITLTDVKLSIEQPESTLFKIAEKKLGKTPAYFKICKKSLDARKKEDVKYVYTIQFSSSPVKQEKEEIEKLSKGKIPATPVMVVGSGPAGLFCALRLIQRGITPIIIERGAPVEEREKDIKVFSQTGTLNTESNVQFGEGGAGTFSDGKLNTQTHSPLHSEVLQTFFKFGAPEEILYVNKPHIGSDYLKSVVKNMRNYLIEKGAKVLFYTRLDDIVIKNNEVVGAKCTCVKTGKTEIYDVSALVLAIGHSARDTFTWLLRRGVTMRQKDFAVGVRIEHLQQKISMAQYGKAYAKLPAADYKLVSHTGERSVFTFCMCPGGYVMPSSSEENAVVTNGMSDFARDNVNANSALIAQVTRADFKDDSALAGVEFQRELERKAYLFGGGNYFAPVQRVEDFLHDRISSSFGEVRPTYPIGTTFANLLDILPIKVVTALKTALLDMDRKLQGFAHPDALLTGVETRTSSPIRIERDKDSLQSVSTIGLFPCGEGAGYAGGITSSATDGIRVADAVYRHFALSLSKN